MKTSIEECLDSKVCEFSREKWGCDKGLSIQGWPGVWHQHQKEAGKWEHQAEVERQRINT